MIGFNLTGLNAKTLNLCDSLYVKHIVVREVDIFIRLLEPLVLIVHC